MSDLRRPSGPCSIVVFFMLSCVASFCAEPNTAVSSAAPAPALSPESQGDLLMAHGHYAAAIDAYQRETHRSAALLNKTGIAYHHMLGFDEARKYYKRALALDPHYAEALSNLASVYFNEGEFRKAEEVYKQALTYKPDGAITLSNLGAAYFAEGKYKSGMEAYARALAMDSSILHPDPRSTIDPESARHTPIYDYYLAKVCATAGRTKEAMAFLQKAMHGGFHDRKRLMKDKELAALRSSPEFQQLMSADDVVN